MSLRLNSDESSYATPRMRFIKPLAWIPQPKQKDTHFVFLLWSLREVDCADKCTYNSGMEIEFDPEKARANPLNHEGVTFEEARSVLLDPYTLTREDMDIKGEQRFVSLGMGGKGRILVAVWTLRGDRIRIISAWKANQPQRRRYEQQF